MKTAVLFILALAYVGVLVVTIFSFMHSLSDVGFALARMFLGLFFIAFLIKINMLWHPPKKN